LSVLVVFSFCFFSGLEAKRTKRQKKVKQPEPIAARILDDEDDGLVFEKEKKPAFTRATERQGIVVANYDEKKFAQERRRASQALVEKAATYLKKNDEVKALRAFTYSRDFINGELYLFVYSVDGACLAHGDQNYLLWKNLYDHQDSFGNYVVRLLIQKAKNGGGWVTYEWKNATKIAYVKQVKKDGKVYVIGCGFYPHSKRETVVNFVDGAASYFNEMVARGASIADVFSKFNYSLGNFVVGNLYLFALDYKGRLMAQGDRPGLIGQNVMENTDIKGKFINKEIIKALEKFPGGAWIDYVSKRAPKRTYARKVIDKKGKPYFIAAGYYPTADRDATVDLVKKGFRYLKMHGITQSIEEFTSKAKRDFRFGDLFLFIYDTKGKVIAHGGNPDLLGKNHFDLTDDDGKYFVREMIAKAKAGGGWMDYKVNRASRFVYLEQVEIGKEKLIIGSGIHPISKPETMQLLVKGGASLLKDSTRETAFEEFVKPSGAFVRGDLSLFAFDFNNICYSFEEDFDFIWRDFSKAKDDNKKLFVKEFIKAVKDGPALLTYKLGGKEKVAYLEKVENNGMQYVVGSSFYK